jgi:hypothetical protein
MKRTLFGAVAAAFAAMVIAGSAGASSTSVRLVHVTSPISAGSYATLVARVSPSRVNCSITVYYKSGPSHAAGPLLEAADRRACQLDLESRDEDDAGTLGHSSLMRRRRCASHVLSDDMSRLVRSLYRSARIANDLETLGSGNPNRIMRRAKNKLVGRVLGRSGLWGLLWR